MKTKNLLLLLLLVSFASAEDWPMFMHDLNRTGYTTDSLLPVNTTATLKLQSSYNFGTYILPSPIISGGYVYIGGNDNKLYQLNASNVSQLIESYTTGGSIYSSPAVSGGYVYFGSNDNKLYQLNASNVSQLIESYTTDRDFVTGPAVSYGFVYVGGKISSNKLYQLNASNVSQVIASYTASNDIYSSPAVSNGFVYATGIDQKIYHLNASNISQLISSYSFGSYSTHHDTYSSPAVSGGYVYFGSTNSKLYQVNASNVSQVIASYTASNALESPTIYAAYVYLSRNDNKLYQLNASNVSQLISYYTTASGLLDYPPAVSGGYLYLGAGDKLYAFTNNHIPNITATSILPSPSYKNSTITCNASTTDSDGDSISYLYNWYVNGTALSSHNAYLNNSFQHFDNVTCELRANDSLDLSTPMNASITISSHLSASVWIDPHPINGTGSTPLTCNYTTSDLDGDSVIVLAFNWFLNGTANNLNSSTLGVGNLTGVQTVSCTVNVSDSYVTYLGQSLNYSVGDYTPPTITPNNIVPSSVVTNNPVVITVNVTDNSSIQSVTVTIEDPNGVRTNFSMTLSSGPTYTKTYTPIIVGVWKTPLFYATDSSNNLGSNSSLMNFTVTSDPGGGGGGGGYTPSPPTTIPESSAVINFRFVPPDAKVSPYNGLIQPGEYFMSHVVVENLESSALVVNITFACNPGQPYCLASFCGVSNATELNVMSIRQFGLYAFDVNCYIPSNAVINATYTGTLVARGCIAEDLTKCDVKKMSMIAKVVEEVPIFILPDPEALKTPLFSLTGECDITPLCNLNYWVGKDGNPVLGFTSLRVWHVLLLFLFTVFVTALLTVRENFTLKVLTMMFTSIASLVVVLAIIV